MTTPSNEHNVLLGDLKKLIEQSRNRIAISVNSEMTLLYWNIGKRINEDVLKNERAEYGEQVIALLSHKLTQEFGKGFSRKSLFHFLRFSEVFPDFEIVSTLSRQLTWSHFQDIIYLKDDLKRQFYIETCRLERWSVRTLREKIQGMLFERTAISRKPEKVIEQELQQLKEKDQLTPDLVFRDPYFLDFLGLSDMYSEAELEDAILVEIQRFISELGTDFAFVARQKRIKIDQRNYRIDLLFYHRRLRRLVVIDLKLGDFQAAYKGQMELYLRWLKKYEMMEGENTPIGLILCAGKSSEHIELLDLESSDIRVAEYLTLLPTKELLQQKLHQAVENAQNKRLSDNE